MKKYLAIILVLLIFTNCAFAYEKSTTIEETAKFLYETVSEPKIGTVGGEWAVMALARSGVDVLAQYYENYYNNVCKELKDSKGILHEKKYTEYSRVVLALTAIGKNPTDVCGYNLLMPFSDYEKTVMQGLNGPVFALIALDSKGYEIPQNDIVGKQATKDMYINKILESQLADGGFSLAGKAPSEPDITAMVLCALAKYRENQNVAKAVEKAINYLSQSQNDKGGYFGFSGENCESTAQVITALCELGISVSDERFIKNNNTIFDNLMSFYNGNGQFKHIDSVDLMATEQAFCALAAVKRADENKTGLYTMKDVQMTFKESDNKKTIPIVNEGKTFADIIHHKNQTAIEELAQRGIINGKSEDCFDPDGTMTRAEFATIIVKSMGFELNGTNSFSDVLKNDWYYNYVCSAYNKGIIKGETNTVFNPNGTITREQAAVMIARTALLCNINTERDDCVVRDILAGFTDYKNVSDWAKKSVAFCYDICLLNNEDIEILPKAAITRAEVAQILKNLLYKADLL